MHKKIDQIEFCVLDTETTGLAPERGDRIIELACVKIKAGQIKTQFHTLINPQRDIPTEALAIHGISQDMLKGAPLMQKVMPEFLKFIQGSHLCAYNAAFDLDFLKKELQLLGQEMPPDIYIIDVLAMARRLLPNFSQYNLAYVAQSLDIAQEQKHRALYDVYTTIAVFNELTNIMRIKGIDDFYTLHSLFGLESPSLQDIRQQKVSRIQEAIDLKVKLKIKYLSRNSAELSEREVIPKQIKQENNKFYLIGFCCLRKEERIFSVDAILHLEIV